MRRIGRALLTLLGIAAVVFAILVVLAKPAPDHVLWEALPDNRPIIIAHQGGEGLRPSNTMAAFNNAMALGVDMLEMDIHSTADGVLVTIHDDTVDRTTDGNGRVNDLTLAEIKALDAGDYFSPDDGATYPYRDAGITIATLEEIFDAFAPFPMNIEIKQVEPSIATPFCQLLRDYGMAEMTIVASFRQQAMDDFRAACPEVATSATEDEVRPFFYRHLAFAAATHSPPAVAVQVPEEAAGFNLLTPRFIRDSHGRNMQVHAWTINESADMQRLIDIGVDGIITDYPDRMLALFGR